MKNVRKQIAALLEEADPLINFLKSFESHLAQEQGITIIDHDYYGDDGCEIGCALPNEWVKYAGTKPVFVLDVQINPDRTFQAHITASFGSANNHYAVKGKPMNKAKEVLSQLVADFKHIVKSNHDQNYRKSLN